MSNIEKYSNSRLNKISGSVIPQLLVNAVAGDILALTITIDNFDINVKDLSSYLYIIYKIDGLLSQKGFNSYSKIKDSQIQITKIEKGSIIFEIQKVIGERGADALVLIWLSISVLKNLSSFVIDGLSKFYELANSREDYLEKRDKRKIRKDIRGILNEEAELVGVDSKTKEKLVSILDEIYTKNAKNLSSASALSKKRVKSINLKVKKK